MKIKLTVVIVLLVIFNAFSQIKFEKTSEILISKMSVKPRIDNSGIYLISAFNVNKKNLYLTLHDENAALVYNNSKFSKKILLKGSKSEAIKKILFDNNLSKLDEAEVNLILNSKKSFTIESKNKNLTRTFSDFTNLACVTSIGADSCSNFFVLVESFITEVPVKVKREVAVFDKNLNLVSRIEVPLIKYLTLDNEFEVDKSGNLYQLISDKNKISIVKVSGLTTSKGSFKYPNEYNYEIHYNNFLPTNEPSVKQNSLLKKKEILKSRTDVLKTAESYVYHKYTCTAANISYTGKSAADGDVVKTPIWVVEGINGKIPYCWGGYNTLAEFDQNLAKGYNAGDIDINGVSDYSVGVDCSGFVSRCWGVSHNTTASFLTNTSSYTTYDDIKPGDIILKSGHVRLFVKRNTDGTFMVCESSGRDHGVAYWSYKATDLTAYAPNYNPSMSQIACSKSIVLNKLVNIGNGKVRLNWTNDTSNVLGYKVYKSTDGINWNIILTENEQKKQSLDLALIEKYASFRVSIVEKTGGESVLSNSLSAGSLSAADKVLIIDGYQRLKGGWGGPGHTFVTNYAIALCSKNVSFESVRVPVDTMDFSKYKAIYWLLSDESTADETFSDKEQSKVKLYLENGGNLFVSGSEIGWDLSYKGTATDKDFYANYLKAQFVQDDATSLSSKGVENTIFQNIKANIIQTYGNNESDASSSTGKMYPDAINTNGGSTLCLKYGNDLGAGIQYSGKFGTSTIDGKVVYIAYPVETMADMTAFTTVISNSLDFFLNITANENTKLCRTFNLKQNYPNPFNPSTVISYQIPDVVGSNGRLTVLLKIYDILGKEVATLVNEKQNAGVYNITFNTQNLQLASGVYIAKLNAGSFSKSIKMNLIK